MRINHILLLLSISRIILRGEAHSSVTAIDAATRPLNQEIEFLNEKIDVLNARHETLEAAAEHFRVKAKSLKHLLDAKISKCDDIDTAPTENEQRLQMDLLSCRDNGSSIEQTYKNRLAEEMTKVAYLQEQKELNDSKVLEQAEMIEALQLIIHELNKSKSESYQVPFLQTRTSSLAVQSGAQLLEYLKESYVWMETIVIHPTMLQLRSWSVTLPQIIAVKAATLTSSIKKFFSNVLIRLEKFNPKSLRGLFLRLVRYISNAGAKFVQAISCSGRRFVVDMNTRFAFVRSKLQLYLENCTHFQPYKIVPDMDFKFKEKVLSFVSTRFEWLNSYYLNLRGVHEAAQMGIEVLAIGLGSGIVSESQDIQSQWFYQSCLFVKMHSNILLILLEVFFGLIAIELAITLMKSCTKATKISKSPRLQSPILSIGVKPSPSLLRSSESFSMRSQILGDTLDDGPDDEYFFQSSHCR